MKKYKLYYKMTSIYNEFFNDLDEMAIEFNKLCDSGECEWIYATKIETEYESGNTIEKQIAEYLRN